MPINSVIPEWKEIGVEGMYETILAGCYIKFYVVPHALHVIQTLVLTIE